MYLGFLLFLLVVDFKLLGGEQNSIPYMWQVILTNVPVEGRIVDSYVDGSTKVAQQKLQTNKLQHNTQPKQHRTIQQEKRHIVIPYT